MRMTRVYAIVCFAGSLSATTASRADLILAHVEGFINGDVRSESTMPNGAIVENIPFVLLQANPKDFKVLGSSAGGPGFAAGIEGADSKELRNAHVSYDYDTIAAPGILHAHVGGSVTNHYVQNRTPDTPGEFGEAAISVILKIGFEDLFVINFADGSVPSGTTVNVHAKLHLTGSVTAITSTNARTNVSMALEGTGIDDSGHLFAFANGGAGTFQAPTDIPLNFPAVVGIANAGANNVFFRMTLGGEVNGIPLEEGDGFGQFTGDYRNTLTWGGIQSVTTQFGEPLSGWTVSSASGFDYSQPFPVPEPSSLALVALAGVCRWLAEQRVGRV
jgi:hypothetical protein